MYKNHSEKKEMKTKTIIMPVNYKHQNKCFQKKGRKKKTKHTFTNHDLINKLEHLYK